MKKILALGFACATIVLAQTYEAVKIDTHGGNDDYSYEQWGFGKNFGYASDSLDKNATKKSGVVDWRK